MNNQEKQEYKHIAVYNSGKADLAKTIIELFGAELSPRLTIWLNIDREVSLEQVAEAEAKL